MLDTNLCIPVLRDRPKGLRPRFNAEADAPCISTVVPAELLHGAGGSAKPVENRREVDRFAAPLGVLPFDADAAAHSAGIGTALERSGRGVGAYDPSIAGHARSRGSVVVTGTWASSAGSRACAARIGSRGATTPDPGVFDTAPNRRPRA